VAGGPQPAAPGSLRRVLTLRTVVSNSAGLTFATTSFIAAAQVAQAVAGDAAWVAVLVAGVLAALVAQSFAELSGMMPSAAALRVYLQRGYREDLALAVAGLYMFVVVLVLAAEAYVLGQALHAQLPALPPPAWIALLLVVALVANWRGVEIAGRLQDVLTYLVVASILAFSVLAFARTGWRLPAALHPGGLGAVAQGAAVGVFLFVGFEWVTPLAEEVTDEALVARGMLAAVGLLTLAYMAITTAMGHVLRPAELGGSTPQMAFATRVAGTLGGLWMVAVCLGASATTFNAGLTAASRFLYATAREGSAPAWLARVHPRYLTPHHALLALFAVTLAATAVVYVTGGFAAIVDLGAAMEAAVYALASVAVLRLRHREPGTPRPYRAPGAPAVQVLTAALFALLAVLSAVQGGWAAVALLGTGAIGAWWYARSVAPRWREAARRRRAARRQALLSGGPTGAGAGRPPG
jgi:amino acid transporter